MASPNKAFPDIEKDILQYWEKNRIFEKSVERHPESTSYVFYDGPPFATGLPHYGHIVASLMKDMVPRFWTMNGRRVERRWGWDCHGLPVENLVEAELGMKQKKDIERFGVAQFNQACESKVLLYADEWKKVIRRIGRWVDMEHDYKTMDLSYMESIWWVFHSLWERGLIYEGRKSMHICPRCETTLSNFEVTQGYKDIEDHSVTIKFPFTEDSDTIALAWTTTPWTLPGNMFLAVNPRIDYSVVQSGGKKYIVATKRVNAVFAGKERAILKSIDPKTLEGKSVEPLFPYYKDQKNIFKIFCADFVTDEGGTGIVHIAPAFGEDDYYFGKGKGVEPIQHVNKDGTFKPEVRDFAGQQAKLSDSAIIKWLAREDKVFSHERIVHSYPHCWRCETALLNYMASSWFVKVTALKTELMANNKKINWVPSHIKDGRFGLWLEGVQDWAISRSRFWGTPLPLWRNIDDPSDILCIGSRKELEQKTGQSLNNLHKQYVDPLEIHKNGKTYHRVPEVLDCWFESGSMPYAESHYPFENQEKFSKNFPAEFIAEGQDQTRGWFYTLHVLATALTRGPRPVISGGPRPAFRNVIVNGIVLAEDGKKMSKRLKNYPDVSVMFEKYGADAVRYYLATSPVMVAENLNFSEKGVAEIYQKVILLGLNILSFYHLYGKKILKISPHPHHLLDQWILARLFSTWSEITRGYHSYNLNEATRPLAHFIHDCSTWYVRGSRSRMKSQDERDHAEATHTLGQCLLIFSQLSAPVMPFLAEHLYRELGCEGESVHLSSWPIIPDFWKNEKILFDMERVRDLARRGLEARQKYGIPVRQPLASIAISKKFQRLDAGYEHILRQELNIRTLEWESDCEGVELDTSISKDLEMEGMCREIIRSINALRKKFGMNPGQTAKIEWFSDHPLINETIQKFQSTIQSSVIASDFHEAKHHLPKMENVTIRGNDFFLLIRL